jgi:hypothetical protein
MNAAGSNTGAFNSAVPSTTPNQNGIDNSQQANSSDQTDVNVEKPKKLRAIAPKRPAELEETTEEALRLKINNPSDQT